MQWDVEQILQEACRWISGKDVPTPFELADQKLFKKKRAHDTTSVGNWSDSEIQRIKFFLNNREWDDGIGELITGENAA